jgi:hypothetical protein
VCAGRSVENSGVILRPDPRFYRAYHPLLSGACQFFCGPLGPLRPRQTPFSPIENAIAKV